MNDENWSRKEGGAKGYEKAFTLSSNSNRASIQVALSHHDTSHGDQRRGGKSKFFGTKKASDCNIMSYSIPKEKPNLK